MRLVTSASRAGASACVTDIADNRHESRQPLAILLPGFARPIIVTRSRISRYLRPDLSPERADKWLRRQLEIGRAKNPPPVFKWRGNLCAYIDELDTWSAAQVRRRYIG